MSEQVVVDPVLRTRYRFSTSAGDDGQDVLHVDMEVDPGGGVTPHIHHHMEEHFTVRAGRPEFLAGRKWTAAGPGETVIVPPGTRHAFRNRGNEVAHVLCEARPPSTLQAFLEDAAALSRAGAFTRHGLPRSLSALLQSAVLVQQHSEMVELLFPPLPPMPMQRWIMAPLARLGQRRGYGARRFADSAGIAWMRHRPSSFWIGLVLSIGLVAFAVDRTTGDETGPPYDDPLINKIAFFVFIGATLLFVALCGMALVRRISRGT